MSALTRSVHLRDEQAAWDAYADLCNDIDREEPMKQQTQDKPGTMRFSPEGDIAFLTTDTDNAPWFHLAPDGRRYFASDDDVKAWPIRDSY